MCGLSGEAHRTYIDCALGHCKQCIKFSWRELKFLQDTLSLLPVYHWQLLYLEIIRCVGIWWKTYLWCMISKRAWMQTSSDFCHQISVTLPLISLLSFLLVPLLLWKMKHKTYKKKRKINWKNESVELIPLASSSKE